MKRKLIVMLMVCLAMTVKSTNAQVTIQFTQNEFPVFFHDDVWKFIILNTNQTSLTCYLKIELDEKKTGQMVMDVSTPDFILMPGSNFPSFEVRNQSQQNYGSSDVANYFERMSQLGNGNYSLCVNIYYQSENKLVAQNCESFVIETKMKLFLQNPTDEESIHTTYPLLKWLPLIPSQNGITYHLKLAELKPYQTNEEALFNNDRFIDQYSISTTDLPYPVDALQLEFGKKYVWQVSAVKNDEEVIVTDIWTFTCDSVKAETSKNEDCYRLIGTGMHGSQYLFSDKIKFAFDNRNNLKSLLYKIVELESGNEVACSYVVPLSAGRNKIDLDFSHCNLQTEKQYLLEVNDANHESFYIRFTRHNKAKSDAESHASE